MFCAPLCSLLPPFTSLCPSHCGFCCLCSSVSHAVICLSISLVRETTVCPSLFCCLCSLPHHVSHTLHVPCFPQEILCWYTTTSMVTWLASLCALVAWRAGRLLNACMPAVRGLITVTSTVWAKGWRYAHLPNLHGSPPLSSLALLPRTLPAPPPRTAPHLSPLCLS